MKILTAVADRLFRRLERFTLLSERQLLLAGYACGVIDTLIVVAIVFIVWGVAK